MRISEYGIFFFSLLNPAGLSALIIYHSEGDLTAKGAKKIAEDAKKILCVLREFFEFFAVKVFSPSKIVRL
jgi:hypothetical protein